MASINRPPLQVLLLLLLLDTRPYRQYEIVLKFVTGYDVREQISLQTNKLRL